MSRPASAHRPESALRLSLVRSTQEALFAMPLVYLNLPANLVVATLLSKTLAVSPDTYGYLVSLPFWCNLLQLAIAPLLFTRWTAREVFLAMIWINIAVWITLGAALFLMPGAIAAQPGSLLGAWFFAAGISAAVMGVAWTTYMQSWVPEGVRAVYFSHRNRWAQLSNLSFLLLAGVALTWPTLPVIGGIILLSCALRAISAVAAHRTPALGDPVQAHHANWALQWRELRDARPFWRMMAFSAAWGAVLNGYGAFQPVFMLAVLTDSARQASWPLALSLLFGALALPVWGRLIERFGARPVMFCAVPLWAAVNFGWAFVTAELSWLLYGMWAFTGAINAGIVLAQLNLLMKLMPAGARSLAVGLNIAATALGTAIAPIVAGQALAWGLGQGWTDETVYHGFFFTLPVFAAATLLLLRRVAEPRAAPVDHVVGALRNFRTLAGALGLGFLAQTLFTPRGAKRQSEY